MTINDPQSGQFTKLLVIIHPTNHGKLCILASTAQLFCTKHISKHSTICNYMKSYSELAQFYVIKRQQNQHYSLKPVTVPVGSLEEYLVWAELQRTSLSIHYCWLLRCKISQKSLPPSLWNEPRTLFQEAMHIQANLWDSLVLDVSDLKAENYAVPQPNWKGEREWEHVSHPQRTSTEMK